MADSDTEKPMRKRAAGRARRKGNAKRPPGEMRGKLRPHDPFELIRWLALSQPDPRKALAELVQNSLDAGATSIRITRRRERGAPCLFIFDDGLGVIPELDRPEALKYIATHVGHSRKRSLSPQQRLELMTQGQYGIGLLGFWSLGQMLEIRTSLPGQRAHRLVLYRDRSDYKIEPLRGRLALDESWTEVVVAGLHREAFAALGARRAADYLGAELRGQLLSRSVDLVVEDRMSRGRAQKVVSVRPPRFLGERLEGFGPLEVPGHPPIRFEIYLSGEHDAGDEPTGLAVYSAGTLVAESFHELAVLGLDRAPWNDRRLAGIVDFPGFRVAPGSRRGVLADAAASAFAAALDRIEPVLAGVLEAIERRRADELDRSMIRDLQRAFRDFYRQRPRYSMLPVGGERRRDAAVGGARGEPVGGVVAEAGPGLDARAGSAPAEAARIPRATLELLPPGPLHAVELCPSSITVECRGRRRVRAAALDAAGRPVTDEVRYEWSLSAPIGTLDSRGEPPQRVAFVAGELEAAGRLSVLARSDGREARAEIEVEILEEIPAGRGGEGIPEPELVDQPAAPWRSRFHDERWQVNTGHREFRAVADRPSLKLRYLAMLFAKEVVLRSHQDPRLERPLEQLVEIASFADRRFSAKRGRRPSQPGGG